MDFRTRRQVAVLLILALVLAGIGVLAFLKLKPEPTCSDNRRNQGEEGVDCGGPCVHCAFKQQKPLEVFWMRFVKSREGTYDVAAEIRNPNAKLAAVSFEYEFKLFDTVGVNVANRRGIGYSYPSETMHLVEIGLTAGRTIRRVELNIRNERWSLLETGAPDLIAGNREYLIEDTDDGRVSAARALITNRTLRDIPGIELAALVFDEGGNLIGVHRSELERLGGGETSSVKFTWSSVFSVPVSSLVVEPRSRIGLPAERAPSP